MKTCTKCKETKPLDQFARCNREGTQGPCKTCNKKYRDERKRETKDYQLKRKFGISLEEYEQRLEDQKHCCAICGMPEFLKGRRLAVDHCHETGKVRELLCAGCNRGIGYFDEDMERMQNAINYIKKWRSTDE